MKVNSFESSIQTPMKHSDRERKKRFSPTAEQKTVLTSMEKVHRFLYHGDISYSYLELMTLTPGHIKEIQTFFNETVPDIPDQLLKLEENAIQKQEFTEIIKNYIAEEFGIPGDYAFSVICILNFSFVEKISANKSGKYLFGLHSSRYECLDCNKNTSNLGDTECCVNINNLQILKEKLNQTLLDNSLDDSFIDGEYEPNQNDSSESESTEDDKLITKDVYEFHDEESFIVFNPFLKSRVISGDQDIKNSTIKSTTEVSKTISEPELTPIKKSKIAENSTECIHCGSRFSKVNNLKRHMISIHKVYPKGTTVYECPVMGCSFVSDSHIHFCRHHHRKSATNKVAKEHKCSLCNNNFATQSSLVRHMKRRHP